MAPRGGTREAQGCVYDVVVQRNKKHWVWVQLLVTGLLTLVQKWHTDLPTSQPGGPSVEISDSDASGSVGCLAIDQGVESTFSPGIQSER